MPVAVDAGNGFHQPSHQGAFHQPVEGPCRKAPDRAEGIGGHEPAIPPSDTSRCGQPLFPEDHQMGKINLVLVRRRIGAVIETELTIVAFVDDPAMIVHRQLCDVSVESIDAVEERTERGAQIETAPASVADFLNALGFLVQLRRIDRLNKGESPHLTP